MKQDEHARLRAGAIGPSAALAIAAAVACLSTPAPTALAGRGGIASHASAPELHRGPTKRWWTEFWGHSMQEEAFIAWMTGSTGGIEWMYLMPAREVNQTYAWWLATVWEPGDPPS